ncbi:SSI family serine proteinase inhibitor [Couchioplanes azureus]|uniref:SSI family serine proteinase inhibitor n=1 Tax=Couchioplanes caeruleus TaxID=56438 RepID=UPI00167186E9|nr:SSI family serine proteinase inhibitor [Couchioplanes caeruleus]GGQ82771.1 protease [Couchioplanes caeruleus subsp. azureus]
MTTFRRIGMALACLSATAAGLAVSTPAQAVPAASASSFVLAIVPEYGGPVSTATLRCEPAGGTHPHPIAACAQLESANGDFYAVEGTRGACTLEYRPVTAISVGDWRGTLITYRETFSNRCTMERATSGIFNF